MYQPQEFHPPSQLNLSFYCNDCDGALVESKDTSSGKFFFVSGCVWNPMHIDPKLLNNNNCISDYPMVIWAICSDCLEEGNK